VRRAIFLGWLAVGLAKPNKARRTQHRTARSVNPQIYAAHVHRLAYGKLFEPGMFLKPGIALDLIHKPYHQVRR